MAVYGLPEAIYRSGYAMMDHAPTELEFKREVSEIRRHLSEHTSDKHIKRAIRLAQAKGGGHDQFLTGIHVDFDLCFSNKAWVEAERYTFLNFITSMSTMHRIAVMPIRDCCNKYVTAASIAEAERLQDEYNAIDGEAQPEEKQEAYLRLLYNLPAGFELTAGMTTNYRCLKNIWAQRHTHRLPDWHIFCDWVATLPLGRELILGEEAANV